MKEHMNGYFLTGGLYPQVYRKSDKTWKVERASNRDAFYSGCFCHAGEHLMNLKKLFLLLPVIILTSITARVNAQTITLDAFLQQLQQKHPLFEKENLTAQIERENQNSFLGTQDWNFFSSVDVLRETPAIVFVGPERTDALSFEAGLEKVFWSTGGRLSLSVMSGRALLDINPIFGVPDAFYQNQIALTYIHPLLKDRGGFLDEFQFKLKQFDIDFSKVAAIENQEAFLAGSAGKFLNWVFLTEQKKILTERSKLSEEELARTQRKRQANLVDQVDVIRAEDAVRISKQILVLVESQLNAVRAELAVLSQSDDLNNNEPEFDLYDTIELPTLEAAVTKVKKDSRVIKAINFRMQQLGYGRKGYQETMKPELAIVAQANTKNADPAFGESINLDKPDLLFGLHFHVPLENRTARSEIAKTDLQLAQLQKQLDEISLGLASAVTNMYIQIKDLQQVLTLNQEQIESAKAKTVEELKLYNQGRGELTFVIQSQDSEQNARLNYAQNALTYHQLIVQYHALLDELLPAHLQE